MSQMKVFLILCARKGNDIMDTSTLIKAIIELIIFIILVYIAIDDARKYDKTKDKKHLALSLASVITLVMIIMKTIY
jgi:uncharacterized membrane protein SirB2